MAKKAMSGDVEAKQRFFKYSESIRRTANERLKGLEKAGLDYGPAYNHFMAYLQSEYKTNRIPTFKQLGSNIEEQMWANNYAVKFLRSPESTVKGREMANQYRIEKLTDYGILPKTDNNSTGNNWREYKDFLKFLGNEEIHSAVWEYGESDVERVDIFWNYWSEHETDRDDAVRMLKESLAYHLDGQISFNEAMRRVGYKIEDYKPKR